MGLHPPLITEDIFNLANDALEDRKKVKTGVNNDTVIKMYRQKGKSLVASFPKTRFRKGKSCNHPSSWNPYKFCSRLPMFYKGPKIKQRLKITSCLLWLPR